MPKTDRRTFLQVLAGAAGFGSGLATHEAAESDGGAVAVVAGPDEPTESLSSAVTAASGLYEEFRVEADPANLPEPDDRPALALTNAGIYEWTEATPSWTQTNILTGTAANKLPPLYSEALTTEEADVAVAKGGISPLWRGEWEAYFIEEPADINPSVNTIGNPLIFHKRHFDDDKHRILITKEDPADTWTVDIYTTSDFVSYTLATEDINTGQGTDTAAGFVRKDGVFVVYSNDSNGNWAVATGDSLTSLTDQGDVVTGESDGGVFYDEDNDIVHHYLQGNTAADSDTLEHYTTPANDLTNSTSKGTAIDVSGESWQTGDPTIEKFGGHYYLFADRTAGPHPEYRIALWRSDALDESWTMLTPNLTPTTYAGDIDIVRVDNVFHALTEFTGADQSGIGHWKLIPRPEVQYQVTDAPAHLRIYDETGEIGVITNQDFGGNNLVSISGQSQGDGVMVGKSASGQVEAQFLDSEVVLMEELGIDLNGTHPRLQTQSTGEEIHFAIPQSGQVEMKVKDSAVEFLSGVNVELNGDLDVGNAYSPSNDTTDRTFDANNTTVAELADVLATLIKDLGVDTT